MMFSMQTDQADLAKMDKISPGLAKAMAFTLTDSAKFYKQDLIQKLKDTVDKPAPFTLQSTGYQVVIAKIGDPNMSSEMNIAPKQSAYEQFILFGGIRGLGDAGASLKHAWVPGQMPGSELPGNYSIKPRLSQYGGVPNGYSQYLYEMWMAQRTDWKRVPGKEGSGAYSQGGVFYNDGRIASLAPGFYARPKRTRPLTENALARAEISRQKNFHLHQRDAHGRFISTDRDEITRAGKKRKRREARVVNRGVPMLLLEAEKATRHHALFEPRVVANLAHARSMDMFNDRASKQLRAT